MAETPIVSESLQKEFRDNFPSQISSGRDLHVSDTIVPIVDFSTTAGVTGLSNTLQSALAFVNQTAFEVYNTSSTLANSAGFWRIYGLYSIFDGGTHNTDGFFLSDGSTSKRIYGIDKNGVATGNEYNFAVQYDFTIFLRSGDSLTCTAGNRSNFLLDTHFFLSYSQYYLNEDGFYAFSTPQ